MIVLVVDDDDELGQLVGTALRRDGHEVQLAGSLAACRASLLQHRPDVLVLDLGLPDGSGLELCRELRDRGDSLPILILTASGEVGARVEGLDRGADDYMSKPFAVAELRARVRALGRRRELALPTIDGPEWSIDVARRRAWRQGLEVSLTPREWAIVDCLARADGQFVEREALLRVVWGEVSDSSAASLSVLVARIRRKLGRTAIRTMRGGGHAIGP